MHFTRPLRILVATRNQGKIKEIQSALNGLTFKLSYLEDFPGLSPVEETGTTYRENAILKARNYAGQTGIFALADDSGLEVDVLGGAPGPYSARFATPDASDLERTEKLLLELSPYANEERTARFVCCMALAGWKGVPPLSKAPIVVKITEGKCEGIITREMKGANGFGFDPVFRPAGFKATFAEMSNDVKRAISHRAQALALMRDFMASTLRQT